MHPRVDDHRGKKRDGAARRKGSALILTMFTIAALLTLGTTFIAISIGESRQARGDKELQMARGVAMYGINWITSYMALPTAWRVGVGAGPSGRDDSIADKKYILRGTNSENNQISWVGRTVDFVPGPHPVNAADTDSCWKIGETQGKLSTGATAVQLTDDQMIGLYDITVTRLSATGTGGNASLTGQPTQYEVRCRGYVFTQQNTDGLFLADGAIDASKAAAVREIKMRIRPQNPLDFAVYEANMRSWNIPGFNTQFGLNNRSDNGLGTIDPNEYPPGSMAAKEADLQRELLHNMYNQVQLDTIGIPKNYEMKGNFRCDGSITPGDPFAKVAGSIHVQASTAADLATIKFTGANNGFAAPLSGQKFDSTSFTNEQKTSIFQGANAPAFASTSRGLPAVADYMTGYVADITSWPTPTGNPATEPPVTTAAVSKADGWAATLATAPPGPNEISGYVKVSTPPTGAVKVSGSTLDGADIEIVDGGSAIQQPGFARVQVSFSKVNGVDKVTVQKVGAYSGKVVPTSGAPYGTYDASQFKNGMLYVDGGNVEVQGTVPANFTVVAAASSDRPTVATPAVRNAQGQLVPQQGLPVLITPQQQSQLSSGQSNPGIYRDGNDAIFIKNADGKIQNIPAWDPVTSKFYWPAYDPKKIGAQAGNSTAVTSEAPLVREGNVSITGDLKKQGTTGSLGIVAQNYVLLSDQSKDSSKNTLQVDAVLMSMSRSVQYGGFLTGEGAGVNPYYQAMAGAGLRRPAHNVTNGTFKLNGSIIGQYADVESTTGGVGYTTQKISADSALRSSMPPCFPNFSRDQMRAPIVWVVVAMSDSASTKAGTTTN